MIPLFKVGGDPAKVADAVRRVYETGYIGQGPEVDRFEVALARLWGVEPWQVVTVNSGTSAIQLALALQNVHPDGPARHVSVGAVTCMADPHAVHAQGAYVDWVDLDPKTGLIDWDAARASGSHFTYAVISTDLGGLSPRLAPTGPIRWTGDGHRIFLVQDAAQNLLGHRYGDVTCYSFQAIKHLTTGDGGAIVVRDRKDAEKARLMRWFGLDRESSADFRCSQNIRTRGYKWHMTDLSAAIGLANIPHAIAAVARSRENARYYQDHLPAGVLIEWQEDASYWMYTILVEDRAAFMERMTAKGIHVSPVQAIGTKHDIFPKAHLPGAEWYGARNVSVPSGFWVGEAEREYIVKAVIECLKGGDDALDPGATPSLRPQVPAAVEGEDEGGQAARP